MRIYQDALEAEIKLTRIVQDLLAYLLLQRHRLHPREVLLDVFWKDATEKQARGCLNTALWRLRCALEPEGIPNGTYLVSTNQGEVGFNPDSDYWLDVADFEEQVRLVASLTVDVVKPSQAAALEKALDLYRGDLLEGNYEDWAIREREHLRHIYLNALAYLLDYHRHQKAYTQALAFGDKILRLDPLREEIHRAMMRMYCDNGQRFAPGIEYPSHGRNSGAVFQYYSRPARGAGLAGPNTERS
jgi:DNA-binding SARP family transcriptional activator